MIKLLLLMLLVLAFVAIVGAVALWEHRGRPRPVRRKVPKPLDSPYKKEDLSWLYAQGLTPEEIQLIAEQNRTIK